MPFKDSIRELNRFRQIIDAIFKEGFGFIIYKIGFRNHLSLNLRLNKKKFETAPDSIQIRLRKIMEDLGGTFIKLGQLLSLRPDLIPKEYAKEFSKLQDQVPPFSYEKVVETIESEFLSSDSMLLLISNTPVLPILLHLRCFSSYFLTLCQ